MARHHLPLAPLEGRRAVILRWLSPYGGYARVWAQGLETQEEHALDTRKSAKDRWEEAYSKAPERDAEFSTMSGVPIKPLYTQEDVEGDYDEKVGYPRGVSLHSRRLPEHVPRAAVDRQAVRGLRHRPRTNARFRYLLEHGQNGLSVAFDMPTLMGLDSDSPLSLGEVGTEGVAVDSLEDMERLFEGIPMGEVSTSMTINAPAMVLLAMYVVAAEKQGVAPEELAGTNQNDILKEYIAQKEWLFPPEPSMRVFKDMLVYATENMPKWNTVSISGYHIREAGSTAAQELAFTLADGFAYVEAGVEAGLDVDDFAPRFSFFFNSHIDFFEEICKFRAARRIWATVLKEKYGAKDEKSLLMRFHTQTAGVSLTAQEPYNNVARTAFEALAAILGGTQSLHTDSLRRGACPPDRRGCTYSRKDAAGGGAGDRGSQHHRSSGWILLRRGADRRARAAGVRVLPPDRRDGGHDPGHRTGLPDA